MSRSHNGYTSPSLGRDGDRDGFEPLNRGDATIDIPLQNVHDTAYTGVQHAHFRDLNDSTPFTSTPMNEKSGLFSRRGKRKSVTLEHPRSKRTHGYDGEEFKVTKMGTLYRRILNYSVIIRYFIYILPVAGVLAIPIIIGATSAQSAEIGGVKMIWVFVWLLCSWVGLWASKIVAHLLPAIFQAACGVVSSGTRKYALVLKNLEIPLSLVGWALVTLATFKPLMTANPQSKSEPNKPTPEWVNVVQQILAASIIATLIYAGECLFIQIISINYHRKQFHARIMESKRTLYLLGLLYDASRAMFPNFCREFEEEDAIINDSLELSFGKHKKHGHNRSGSSTPARVLHDISNLGDKVTEAFGNVAKEVTGKKNTFNPSGAHSIVTKALEKNRSCEALARRLWLSFVIEGQDALYQDDLIEVLGTHQRAEAEESFSILDRDGNGNVSLDEMVLTISSYGRDRSAIANSMHDVDQAIKVLDRMLCVVIFIIIVFIFVAFLNASFVTTLATAGTALLSLSFVFSTSAQEILGSCIFLFVKHPFDIGDRVDLNATGGSLGDRMIVEHISLLFTVFRRIDSHRTVQIPNIVLNTVWIENVSRSNAMAEQLQIYVAFDTSLEDIQLLRAEMKKFVTSTENSRDFHNDINVEVLDLGHMDSLQLQITIQNKSNPANESVRAARRSKFMCALVLALRKVPIYGPGGGDAGLGSVGNPSYSVSVSDMEAAAKRDTAAKEKDAKRLLPAKKSDVKVEQEVADDPAKGLGLKKLDSLATATEMRGMTVLSERSLAFDGARDAGTSRGGGGVSIAISPALPSLRASSTLEGGEAQEQAQLLRRETTNKGRRKSNRSGNSDGAGAATGVAYGASVGSSYNVPDVPQREASYRLPRNYLGPLGTGTAQSTSEEDEDWYGDVSQREQQQQQQQPELRHFPAPPASSRAATVGRAHSQDQGDAYTIQTQARPYEGT